MRGSSNLVYAIIAMKQTKDQFELFQLEYPNTVGATMFANYQKKIEWVYKDLITNPMLTEEVRAGLRKEWESDIFTIPAIMEKISFIKPDQREFIENLVDAMLKGEEVKIIEDPKQ